MEEALNTTTTTFSIPTTSTSPSNSPMDTRIWRNLPQPLVDRVIAFLPPPAFFRARSVCKRFYALLFSDVFLEMYLRLSPRLHFFIFFPQRDNSRSFVYSSTSKNQEFAPNNGFIFDTYENSWYRISFDGLVPPGFSPAASSGGLICWASDNAGAKTLIMCNPLSKIITQLPATPRPRLFPSVGLTVGHSSFSVVVAGDDLISPFAVKNLTTESFHVDGVTGFYSPWASMSPLPRLCNLESGRMVYMDGKFYCMNFSPFSVLVYDVPANAWSKIQAPMRRFLRSPSLVESCGKVVMVAAVEKSKLNVPRSLRMWALQPCGTAWAEVERMPQPIYGQFMEMEGGHGFDCVGHGEFIAVTIRGSSFVLLFDFYRKVWQWAPPCPFLCGHGGGGLRGFAYEPRLATPSIGLLDSSSLSFQTFSG